MEERRWFLADDGMTKSETEVHNTLSAINLAWREGRPSEMTDDLHPGVVMVLPQFAGMIAGREKLISSFSEFCSNARVLNYTESDEQIQVVGHVAVASFRFVILYERSAYRERSTGRDVWIFERSEGKWRSVWRTMMDVKGTRE